MSSAPDCESGCTQLALNLIGRKAQSASTATQKMLRVDPELALLPCARAYELSAKTLCGITGPRLQTVSRASGNARLRSTSGGIFQVQAGPKRELNARFPPVRLPYDVRAHELTRGRHASQARSGASYQIILSRDHGSSSVIARYWVKGGRRPTAWHLAYLSRGHAIRQRFLGGKPQLRQRQSRPAGAGFKPGVRKRVRHVSSDSSLRQVRH